MKRLARSILFLLFSTLLFLPSTAFAGTVDVTVTTFPWGIGSTTGSGSYYTDTDYVDVDVWWIGTDAGCWEFDHWELQGSSVVQSYQNPANIRVFQSSGNVGLVAVVRLQHDRVYHPVVYPTCISDGNIEYYSCASCGRLFSDYDMTNEVAYSDVVWPGGSSWHNLAHIDFQYADCENDGRKEHYWCSTCQRRFWDSSATSEIYGSDWVLPAGGHNPSYVPGTLPTCTASGSKEYYECLECGKWFWDSACTHEIAAHSTEILLDPTGHNFGAWQVTKAATCAVDGQEERTCQDCHGSLSGGIEMRTIPATGNHTWDKGKETTKATYDSDGVRTYTCTVCGATRTETIPKLLYNVYTRCSPGFTGWLTGDGDYAKGTSVTVTAAPIEGYTFVHWVDTNSGAVLTTDTSYTFKISSDMDITAVFEKIHVHVWKEVKAKEPTCTEKGNEAYFICSDCGMIVRDTESLERLLDVPEIAALGHDWDAGKVTREPTETAEGVMTFTCRNCGATRTEPIPKKEKGVDPSGGGGGNVTPTPTPTPTPDPGFPVPLVIAGAVGLVALGALIAVLFLRKREDE